MGESEVANTTSGEHANGDHLQSNRVNAELHGKMQEETTKTLAHGSGVH